MALTLSIATIVSDASLAQSNKIYEELQRDEGIPMCVIFECVEVPRAGASVTQDRREPASTNENRANGQPKAVDEGFVSGYQPQPGVLGANTNLEAEFKDFLAANHAFLSTFARSSPSATNRTSSGGYTSKDFDSGTIKEKGTSYGKEAWSKIINSQNAYFDSIAWIAGAETDGEAQNAIAHATISAHITMELGEAIAESIGDTKEIAFRGDDLDTAKDLLNNAAGREIAREILANGGTVADIPVAIAKAYRDGELWIIRDGKIAPSNEKPSKQTKGY